MSIALVYRRDKFEDVENLFEFNRQNGSLFIIEDKDLINNIDILTNPINSNYIFIVLNGNEKKLIKKMKDHNFFSKPKGVFAISKETEETYFNELPNLLPCIDKWNSNVSNLFKRIKAETRAFFNSVF